MELWKAFLGSGEAVKTRLILTVSRRVWRANGRAACSGPDRRRSFLVEGVWSLRKALALHG